MVSVWCYKDPVNYYRYPHIPYSTCISSFLAAASLLLCSFKNVFSFLFVIFVQKKFEIVQKLRSREYGDLINYIDKNVERTLTVRAQESQDFHVRGTT